MPNYTLEQTDQFLFVAPVNHFVWSPDGMYLAVACGAEFTLQTSDATQIIRCVLSCAVTHISWQRDALLVGIVLEDGAFWIWDMQLQSLEADPLMRGIGWIEWISSGATNCAIATTNYNEVFWLRPDTDAEKIACDMRGIGMTSVCAVVQCPMGDHIVAADTLGRMYSWNDAGELCMYTRLQEVARKLIAMSTDHTLVLGMNTVYSYRNYQMLGRPMTSAQPILDLVASPRTHIVCSSIVGGGILLNGNDDDGSNPLSFVPTAAPARLAMHPSGGMLAYSQHATVVCASIVCI